MCRVCTSEGIVVSYVTVIMPCAACNITITCNPVRVPSIKNDAGNKVPLCFDCATYLNKLYAEAGKDTIPIHPDAYSAADENEVVW